MKTKKTIIALFVLILLLTTSSTSGTEKYKGDTIRIWFDEFMIEVHSVSLEDHSLLGMNISETAATMEKLLSPVDIAAPESDEMIRISISDVDGKNRLDFKKATFEKVKRNSKHVVFSKGTILEKDFGNYVIEVEDIDFTVLFYLKEIAHLKKFSGDSFENQISVAQALIPGGRKKINGWLNWNGSDNFDSHFLSETSPYSLDMLHLSAGIGAGAVKNQWVNDINFRIGFGFGTKGIYRNIYYAEYKLVYDFSETGNDNIFSINSFLSLGWEHNFSNNLEKENWIGLSVGYLVSRKTDFYEKNTWKISMQKRINQTVSVSPELYFNEFFKNIYPGVQVGINF